MERVPYEKQCAAEHYVDHAGVLACWLQKDHEGPHYDAVDDVTWKAGEPDD